MKELIRVRVQYASRQQCCKTHKRPLPLPFLQTIEDTILLGATLCWIAIVSAKCYRYLQNWKRFYVAGEEGFSFLKKDTK